MAYSHAPVSSTPQSREGGMHMDAVEFGVGARINLYPMTDRYSTVIADALDEVADTETARELRIVSEPAGVLLRGREIDLTRYLVDLVVAAARHNGRAPLAASILLSRGCPGEIGCPAKEETWQPDPLAALPRTGVHAQGEWSLYPLTASDETSEHMPAIMQAIDSARRRGLVQDGGHFATRLSGDVADVLSLVVGTWSECGRTVRHVAAHANLLVNAADFQAKADAWIGRDPVQPPTIPSTAQSEEQ